MSGTKLRIRQVLQAVGMASLPASSTEPLADHGFDSLMIVLTVAQLEKEFGIKIPGAKVDEENFASIDSIGQLLASLGVK